MSKLDKALYGLFLASVVTRLVGLERDLEGYIDNQADAMRNRRVRYMSAAVGVAWVSKLALRRR